MIDDRIEQIRKRMQDILGCGSCGASCDTTPYKSLCSNHSPNPCDSTERLGFAGFSKTSPRLATKFVQETLSQKQHELKVRERDLETPYYTNDEWTKRQISLLKEQIDEIERYLAEGGNLRLPFCGNRPDFICLIAISGFDSCIMQPDECGFSLGV